jgi:ABC-type glycerol-3-phosphate transport system permease component
VALLTLVQWRMRRKGSSMKREFPVWRRTLLYGLLRVLCVPFVFPTWWMVTSSLKPIREIFAFPQTLLPSSWDFSTYGQVFKLQPFGTQYLNSVFDFLWLSEDFRHVGPVWPFPRGARSPR